MADNIDVTPGTGKTVASKEISSTQYQKILLADPVTGDPVDVSASSPVKGFTAEDSAIVDAPVPIGGRAKTTNPTAVADNDVVYTRHDKTGRVVVAPYQVRDLLTRTSGVITISASTSETDLIAAGGSGVFLDMLSIKLCNTSASAVRVDIRDAAAGTVQDTWYIPAGQTIGQTFSSPLKQTTANNKWTAQCSGSVTDVRIMAQFAQNV